MKSGISVRVQIDPACREPEVVIRTDRETPLVSEIAVAVESCVKSAEPRIAAYRGGALTLLSQREIIRVYTENRRLVMRTAQGEYESKNTLQTVEGLLDPAYFLRISRFELINIRRAERFDFSVAGTVSVTFDDGSATWVARRYVRAVQQAMDRLLGREGGGVK